MTASLVWLLGPTSVIFTAVLSYRVGAYWDSDGHSGRHRAGRMPRHDSWDGELVEDEVIRPPSSLPLRPVRWWGDEDDTEVLPQIGDE